jgi:transcriptional regulator with XRE-family HTH domain
MRSKILKEILEETPNEVDIFVKLYGDIVVRVHQILREQGISQKELAERLGKTPSEISKWLSGSHNFTLTSLAKVQAELGETILYVPKKDSFHVQVTVSLSTTVKRRKFEGKQITFVQASESKSVQPVPMLAS